jgi:hypothetical protein
MEITMPTEQKIDYTDMGSLTTAEEALREATVRYEELRNLLVGASGEHEAIRDLCGLAEAKADAEFGVLLALIGPFFKQRPELLREKLHHAARSPE